MRQFLQFPKFFTDRIQLIFALLLACIVLIIAYIITVPSRIPQSPNTTPTPTSSVSQSPQGVTPTVQNGSLNIQANDAVAIVENLKEIQDAKSAADTINNKVVTEVDSYPTNQNNFYVIHAYQIVPDGNGNAHTATVGWFKVDPQTGTVTNIAPSP